MDTVAPGDTRALRRGDADERRRTRSHPSRLLRASAVMFILAAAGAAGCDESVSDVAGPTSVQATFSSIQSTIFESGDANGRPACTDCHNAQAAALSGGLNLSHDVAYANLVSVPSRDKAGAVRVIPGDPANSYVIHKLEGRSGIVGLRMPTSGPYLTAGQIAVIQRWIELGARRD